MQKDTFYVRKLPMVMIVFLTLGLIITSFAMGTGSMLFAMLLFCVQGIILIFLIYKQDRIEPEPVSLLVKLFIVGAIPVPIIVMLIETAINALVSSASDNGLFVLASVLALVIIMCVLNVNAYKNIKKYVHEDRPVRTKS